MKFYLYHSRFYEKFTFGINGEQHMSIDNDDKGLFKVQASDKYNHEATKLSKGCMPGLLYEFDD